MIGKHIQNPKTHSSFRALNDYISGKSERRSAEKEEKIAYTDCLNLLSVETATSEMESLAFMNKRCKDPVMHLLLSWRENETPTKTQVREAVEITLDELNLSQCQVLYSLHQNTDNLHLHICVNRIDPETHKAITPAGGWTRRAMERAARRIEAAQGWQVEENTWSEVNEHGEIVQKSRSTETTTSQAIRDKENLTGEQSAARKAQDILKNAVESISSWNELHALMHKNGMEYRKKGSGAVIQVGEVMIKASAVSRNFTLNKLEKKFGAYRPPREGMKPNIAVIEKISSPQPLSPINDNERWREFIAARNEHFENKKQIREELDITQMRERRMLKDNHREERAELFRSLRGRGLGRGYINRQSSLLAARHAVETATQKQEHNVEREKLRQASSILQSYESWLRSQDLSTEVDAWRHRKNENFIELHAPHDAIELGEGKPSGILGFRLETSSQGVKFYSCDATQAAFVDLGKKIRIYRHDDEALLAALQLAQQKWGGVQLSGSEEYKRRCAELAARNGIRVANPELREAIAAAAEAPEERARRMAETSKILRQKAMELARKYIPDGMIIMTDAQDGKTYSGTIIGVVSYDEHAHALQKISENQIIRYSVVATEREQLEQAVGRDVLIISQDWRVGRIEDSTGLRNQRQVWRWR